MPDEGGVIKFKNHNHSVRVSLVVKPISGCERRSDKSFTNKYQKHIICDDDKLYSQEPIISRANSKDEEDVAQIFVEMLEDNIKRIHREFDPTHCWICKGSLNDMVRDHGHFTGKYRGAPHYICNLQFKKPKFTPLISQLGWL